MSNYRFADNAGTSQSNEYGNYILKRGAGEIRKPTWNRTETVVRFLPCWNFEESRWEPYRRSPSPMDLGDWIRRYDAVRGFGDKGVTMLLFDPIENPSYDIQSNPCVILYRAINSAIDNKVSDPEWPSLLRGAPGKGAPLKRQQSIYIARVGIFRINSKDMATADRAPLGLAATDPAYFLELPKTAGEKLISMMEEQVENYEGDPDDYDKMYKYGDLTSLDKGAYVHLFEEGADPRNNTSYQGGQRQLTVGSGGRGNYSSGGGGQSFKGYDIFIDKTWNGFASTLNSPELEKLIKSKQRPWEDCLQFFDHQEQAFLIQDGFPASAILYAWRDHPEWIKDETRSRAVSRVSTIGATAGYPGAQQAPQQQAPQAPARSWQPPVAPSAMLAPPAPVSTPPSDAVVPMAGGWGTQPSDDLKDAAGAVAADGATAVKNREQKAMEALEAAKQRVANRV